MKKPQYFLTYHPRAPSNIFTKYLQIELLPPLIDLREQIKGIFSTFMSRKLLACSPTTLINPALSRPTLDQNRKKYKSVLCLVLLGYMW
jgi:hypothetical protein